MAGGYLTASPVAPRRKVRVTLVAQWFIDETIAAVAIHPYVLVGAAKLWTQSRTPLGDWTNNEGVYPQGGIGLVIPLPSRLTFVPEVRLDYLVLGGTLRPNVAVAYRLH
jgi:hypothetical protein